MLFWISIYNKIFILLLISPLSQSMQLEQLTEYAVKCEYCGETAQPSLDLPCVQWPEVGNKIYINDRKQTPQIYLMHCWSACILIRQLCSSAVPGGRNCVRCWRGTDVCLGTDVTCGPVSWHPWEKSQPQTWRSIFFKAGRWRIPTDLPWTFRVDLGTNLHHKMS